jgi:hypothetical protein
MTLGAGTKLGSYEVEVLWRRKSRQGGRPRGEQWVTHASVLRVGLACSFERTVCFLPSFSYS